MIASHRSNTSIFRFFRGAATRCLLVAVPLAVSPAAHATSYNLQFVIDPTGNGNINLLGINDSGVIAGFDGSSGFTLTLPGNFTAENYPSPPASGPSMVTGINAAGDTSGIYMDAAGNTHGFTDIGGTFKTVDNTLSTVFNQALGINNSDETVGYYAPTRLDNQATSLIRRKAARSPTSTICCPPTSTVRRSASIAPPHLGSSASTSRTLDHVVRLRRRGRHDPTLDPFGSTSPRRSASTTRARSSASTSTPTATSTATSTMAASSPASTRRARPRLRSTVSTIRATLSLLHPPD